MCIYCIYRESIFLPGHRIHKQEVIIRWPWVPPIIHVFLLRCVFDVFNNWLHLFTKIRLLLEVEIKHFWFETVLFFRVQSSPNMHVCLRDCYVMLKSQQRLVGNEHSDEGEWHTSSHSESGRRDEMNRTEMRARTNALINTSMGSLCFTLALTGKMPSCSWRSSTSFTSVAMLLLLGACQVPASVPRPGRQGKTLLANWRHSGQVNSPLSTEKPCRTWSFWKTQRFH